MPFQLFKDFKILLNRIIKRNVIVMMTCTRCATKQKKCRMSLLSHRCEKCIRFEKKCELAHFVLNFEFIDRAMKKLKRKKLKIKIA